MSKQICCYCNTILTESNAREFDGNLMCESCYEAHTSHCDCCLERCWNDELIHNPTYTLCRYCYENNYTTCSECGALIHNDDVHYSDDDDEAYCLECYDKLNSAAICSYHYKPEPIFHGSGSLYFGVELEIDEGGELNSNAQQILDLANVKSERIYCKHDGSLQEGFEIVSHPMSLDYHTKEMNWKELMSKAIELGYSSHNTTTCGLHIHCNRDFFGDDYDEQERAIGRVVYFVEKHWNELKRFSRRTTSSLNRWAAKYATISETIWETYNKAKSKDMGRYVAINLNNYNTVEFRMFRGTLRYETFLATLQLVDEICKAALLLSDHELQELSWCEFVRLINKNDKPELINYLKTRNLYVNETVEERGEI